MSNLKLIKYANNIYEVEEKGHVKKIYRQIDENEYLDWYIGDTRISRRGKILRLFLLSLESPDYRRNQRNGGKETKK